MSDTDDTAVPAPFDEVPTSSESEENSAPESGSTSFSVPWLRVALIALFIAAVGFGQGLGLTLLFDGEPERLSTRAQEKSAGSSGADHGSAGAHDAGRTDAADSAAHPSTNAPQEVVPSSSEPHELDVARERFEMGDVEWARRTAAAFLLRMDGLGYEDTRRSSAAYAMLADVLRQDYERSLRDGPAGQAEEAQVDAHEESGQGSTVEGGH